MNVPNNVAAGTRYVGLAVIPKRRRPIEHALGRIAELGGDALLITADGSSKARYPGVRHIDLLSDEMRLGPNRLLAVSPKRVAGKLVGRKVGGRSLAWRGWSGSRPYKVFRYRLLWKVLEQHIDEVDPATVTNILIAGVESWPIAWHISRSNPGVQIGWDVPDEWKRPVEEEPLGLRRIAVWGGNATWYLFSQGGPHRAELVHTFAASSWVAQAGTGCAAAELVPPAPADDLPLNAIEAVDEEVSDHHGDPSDPYVLLAADEPIERRAVRQDLTASLVSDLIAVGPEAVVIDALPEFTDLLKVGDWCTSSPFAEEIGIDGALRARATEVLAWDHPDRAVLFRESVRSVASRLMEGLPEARFILHRLWFTPREEDEGRRRSGNRAEIDRVNARLDEYYAAFADVFGDRLEVLEVPPELRVMGRGQPRGMTHRGFVTEYAEAAQAALDAMLRASRR